MPDGSKIEAEERRNGVYADKSANQAEKFSVAVGKNDGLISGTAGLK